MTQEEKINEIHDTVIEIKSSIKAEKTICQSQHRIVDERIHGLHRVIKGNGQPGIEQNLQTLSTRFDKLETKIITYAAVAIFLGQIIAPKVLKLIGWN